MIALAIAKSGRLSSEQSCEPGRGEWMNHRRPLAVAPVGPAISISPARYGAVDVWAAARTAGQVPIPGLVAGRGDSQSA